METPDAWLRPLKNDKKVDEDEVSAQNHHLMSLVGFDHVIVLEEKKWSDKTICRAVAIIIIGALQLAVAVTLLYCGISPQIAVGLIGASVGDVLFAMNALLTGEHFQWADYSRHKKKQIVRLLAKTAVGIAEDGFIMEGNVPLEDIMANVAKELRKAKLTTRSHLNEVDVNIDSRRVLRILHQERKQEEVICHSQTTDNIQTCLNLMKKTKDPRLFAVLIRDKVPIDQFCADALSCVLSAHLGRKVAIQVDNTEQVFDHHETTDRRETSVVKIERGVFADDRCMLLEFIQTVHMDKTQEMELRQSLASLIETDPSVTAAIREVWQSCNLHISLLGSHLTNKKGIEKTDFAVTGIVPKDQRQLGKRHIFQNDYAFIHSAIKDGEKRKIPCQKYPVLTVTYPEDGGATGKEEDFKLFRHVQRGHLERDQFKNAIWNTVETNWMPIAKQISETGDDIKKNLVASVKDHFQKSTNEGLIDGQKMEELNKILDCKMARLSGNEAQGNPAVNQP